jgi:hypothetical protein
MWWSAKRLALFIPMFIIAAEMAVLEFKFPMLM